MLGTTICFFLFLLGTTPHVLSSSFVTVDKGTFVLPGTTTKAKTTDDTHSHREFPVSGFNLWEAVEAGSGATDRPSGSPVVGTEYLRTVFSSAQEDGFSVIRVFAHGVTPEYASMDGGGYGDERMLVGLDTVVALAQEYGLKLILSFVSNWTPAGGVDSFSENLGKTHDDFFQSDDVKDAYKNWVTSVVARTNSVTGDTYAEDPTIFAWNLINEPQCRTCEKGTLQKWIEEMCIFVKSLDDNHLVAVGEEGYYSLTDESLSANPQHGVANWAQEWGQDFVQDHAFDCIDFATFHAWVDNWHDAENPSDDLSLFFSQNWISQHVQDTSRYLKGKPLVLEEFGKTNTPDRDEYFKAAYEAVEQSMQEGGPLRGALYWQHYVPGQTTEWYEQDPVRGPWGVYREDSAHQYAVSNAAAVKAKMNRYIDT